MTGAVEIDEVDVLAVGGGVELDRYDHHPEANCAVPDGSSCHGRTSNFSATALPPHSALSHVAVARNNSVVSS